MDKILIEQTLNNLDSLYQNNPADQVYYSKLAILELSGWLEETIDELLIHYSQSKLNLDNLKYFEEKIKNTWGANYSSNIRNLLIIVVGLINVETIENNLKQNGGYLDLLKNTTKSLKKARDDCAHTSTAGVTQQFQAPSYYKQVLINIYDSLIELEKELNLINP